MNKEETQKHDEQARIAREHELADVLWLMQHAKGRRFMWRLLSRAMVFQTTFTGNSTTFFNEGRRALGLELLADVNNVALPEYMQMTEEAKRV